MLSNWIGLILCHLVELYNVSTLFQSYHRYQTTCFPGIPLTSPLHNVHPVHYLLSHTTVSGKRGMNPVTMTVFYPQPRNWLSVG